MKFTLDKTLENLMEYKEMLTNKKSILHCEKCHFRFTSLVLAVKSCGVKKGEYFYVKCRKCKHINRYYKEKGE